MNGTIATTFCTKCKTENTYCSLTYPWYCHGPLAWKKAPGAREETCVMCCRCVFKYVYRGRNDLGPCTCRNVFYAEKKTTKKHV